MTLNRRSRLLTVCLTVWALLFAQAALAGYSCPSQSDREQGLAMAGMPCADSMALAVAVAVDEAQPALCHAHCQDQQQSADSYQPPLFATSAQLGAVLTLAPVADKGSGPLPPLPQWRRDTAPPLSVRHCCLRL